MLTEDERYKTSCLNHSSRYFHWKLNLYVILLVLIFVVPFYIGYFVVSNIRLCKYDHFTNCKDQNVCWNVIFHLSAYLCSAEAKASFCLYGLVHFHVFLLEVGRPVPHLEPKTWWVSAAFFTWHQSLLHSHARRIGNTAFINVSNRPAAFLFTVCCWLFCRNSVHWAANQSSRCDWSHSHGSAVWVWCCQLSLHIHVIFPEVSSLMFFFFFSSYCL